MKLSIVTTCGDRLAHLAETLPTMATAANDAADVVDCELLVVDYGPTPGVAALVDANPPARRIVVQGQPWNFGKARAAGLAAATGDVFINVDCDGFLDGEALERVVDRFEGRVARYYLRSAAVRGIHGRFAFWTGELREIGGFYDADDIDGKRSTFGEDIEDVYDRADAAGFHHARWPKPFAFIAHEMDKQAARDAGKQIRRAIVRRQNERRERRRLQPAKGRNRG